MGRNLKVQKVIHVTIKIFNVFFFFSRSSHTHFWRTGSGGDGVPLNLRDLTRLRTVRRLSPRAPGVRWECPNL